MSTGQTSDFLLLSRGQWDQASSKADIEAAIDKFYAWYEAQIEEGRFKPGSRLTMDAALVTREGVSTDGPFAEAKEVLGGYALMQAASKAEVIELTRRFLDVTGQGTCEIYQLYEMPARN